LGNPLAEGDRLDRLRVQEDAILRRVLLAASKFTGRDDGYVQSVRWREGGVGIETRARAIIYSNAFRRMLFNLRYFSGSSGKVPKGVPSKSEVLNFEKRLKLDVQEYFKNKDDERENREKKKRTGCSNMRNYRTDFAGGAASELAEASRGTEKTRKGSDKGKKMWQVVFGTLSIDKLKEGGATKSEILVGEMQYGFHIE